MGFRFSIRQNERSLPLGQLAASVRGNLRGKTVGFISNGKEGTKGFFVHLDRMLREELALPSVVSRVKSNYSAPADRLHRRRNRQLGMPSLPGSGD